MQSGVNTMQFVLRGKIIGSGLGGCLLPLCVILYSASCRLSSPNYLLSNKNKEGICLSMSSELKLNTQISTASQ